MAAKSLQAHLILRYEQGNICRENRDLKSEMKNDIRIFGEDMWSNVKEDLKCHTMVWNCY